MRSSARSSSSCPAVEDPAARRADVGAERRPIRRLRPPGARGRGRSRPASSVHHSATASPAAAELGRDRRRRELRAHLHAEQLALRRARASTSSTRHRTVARRSRARNAMSTHESAASHRGLVVERAPSRRSSRARGRPLARPFRMNRSVSPSASLYAAFRPLGRLHQVDAEQQRVAVVERPRDALEEAGALLGVEVADRRAEEGDEAVRAGRDRARGGARSRRRSRAPRATGSRPAICVGRRRAGSPR